MIRWWHRRKGHTQQTVRQWYDFHLLVNGEIVECSCGKRWVLLEEVP